MRRDGAVVDDPELLRLLDSVERRQHAVVQRVQDDRHVLRARAPHDQLLPVGLVHRQHRVDVANREPLERAEQPVADADAAPALEAHLEHVAGEIVHVEDHARPEQARDDRRGQEEVGRVVHLDDPVAPPQA